MTHDHEHGDHVQASRGPFGAIRASLGVLVGAHAHHAAGEVDRELESSARGIRALKLSLVALGLTALGQLAVVLASGSVALLADTAHNVADALTAVPLWVAFALGRRAADRRYTYGYGRAEDVAGVLIVLAIAASAAFAAWESVQRLAAPQPVQNIGWVLAAGFLGFLGNEAVALFRIKVGREIGSAALVADGHHARADGLTSLGVVLSALGVLAGYPIADPIAGLAITVAILFVLRDAGGRIFHRLMDAVEPELTASAERIVAATPGVEDPPDVRIRWVGHQLWADVRLTVNADRSLAESHAVAEDAKHRLLHDLPRLAQVQVHVDPCQHTGLEHHAATAHHYPPRRSA